MPKETGENQRGLDQAQAAADKRCRQKNPKKGATVEKTAGRCRHLPTATVAKSSLISDRGIVEESEKSPVKDSSKHPQT